MFHYDFAYGLCNRFNMGKTLNGTSVPIRSSGQVGFKYGLQLELYAGSAQVQEKFAMTRGFRVLIFNRTNVYPIGQDMSVDVPKGQATNIGIRRIFTNHLPYPYSNCLPSDVSQIKWTQNEVLYFMYENFVSGQYYNTGNFWEEAGNWTWDWTVSYSQSICVKLCFQRHLYLTCGK
jgi:hypothetical protein